jgi:hypothetical protein
MSQRRLLIATKVDRVLNKLHNTGKLQWFNAAFAAERCKNPALNYRRARIRLRRLIVYKLMHGQPLVAKSLAAETFAAQSPKSAPVCAEMDRADG